MGKEVKNPLSKTHPKLAKQADGWDASKVSMGSSKKLRWKCSQGHKWLTSPNTRTNQNSGCPYCSGKYLLEGFNDLATTHPKLAKEADGWNPRTLGKGSQRRVSWKCKGHKFIAKVSDRVSGTGCPYCAGRKVLVGFNDLNTTHPKLAKEMIKDRPEKYSRGSGKSVSWKCTENHTYKMKISARTIRSRGCPVCAGRKVVGTVNDLATTHPQLAKEAHGWNPRLYVSGSSKKVEWKCKSGHKWSAVISNRALNSTGCPTCIGRKVLKGFNDLLTTHPKVALEANGWDPTTLTRGSEKVLTWKCPKNHDYEASVSSRTRGRGCPVCSGAKVQSGANDLASTHPDLARQADGWDPSKVSAGSQRILHWTCDRGHRWKARVKSRAEGRGCPVCSNKVVSPGVNDLATTHPEIAIQAYGWDPKTVTAGSRKRLGWRCELGHIWYTNVFERRETMCAICTGRKVLAGYNDLDTTHPELAKQAFGWNASSFVPGSPKRVDWKCELGHIWKASIVSRTGRETGCPFCSGTRVCPGFNDLATTHPLLALEAKGWDTTKYSAGSGKKVCWQCSEGHVWETRVISRVKGSGCPSCSSTQYDPNLTGYLYFLKHENWSLLQIGITNQPEKRLAKHRNLGWDVIEVLEMDGLAARNWETEMLRVLRTMNVDLGVQTKEGKFDGYSECWKSEKYYPRNLAELMSKVREREELELQT